MITTPHCGAINTSCKSTGSNQPLPSYSETITCRVSRYWTCDHNLDRFSLRRVQNTILSRRLYCSTGTYLLAALHSASFITATPCHNEVQAHVSRETHMHRQSHPTRIGHLSRILQSAARYRTGSRNASFVSHPFIRT